MTRLAFIASLLLVLSGALPAQQQQDKEQQDKEQQDKQQGQQSQQSQQDQQKSQQQNQQQSGQSQQSSDAPPAPEESTSKKSRADDDNGGKGATPDEPPAISSDAEKAKAAATYNPLPAQQDIEVGTYYLHKGDIDAAIDRFLDAIQQRPNLRSRACCWEKPTRKSTITSRP